MKSNQKLTKRKTEIEQEKADGERSSLAGRKVECKLMESTSNLDHLLTEEKTARLKSEMNAKITQNRSNEEIQKICVYVEALKDTTLKLEQLLEEEQTARLKMENFYRVAQRKSEAKIHKVELKLKDTTLKLEKLLTKENAKVSPKKSDDEIEKVKWNEKNADVGQKKLSKEALWLREKQQRANKREKKHGRLCVLE
ncbi:hypothetical protein LXL04_031808 [Taraxacum kok-saghyz]